MVSSARRRLLLTVTVVSLLIVLPACSEVVQGGAQPDPNPTVSGNWGGFVTSQNNAEFRLELVEAGGQVEGSAILIAGTGDLLFSVIGSHTHPAVELTMSLDPFDDFVFTGAFLDDDTIDGQLNGAGFDANAVTLQRSQP